MTIYLRPNSPSVPAFFSDAPHLSGMRWVEIVYQSSAGPVGLQLESPGRAFLIQILEEAWRFDRNEKLFIHETDSEAFVMRNLHNMHNVASIAVIEPTELAEAAFGELKRNAAISHKNELLKRLGKPPLQIGKPTLEVCFSSTSRAVPWECLNWLVHQCGAVLLLRSSEYGLHGVLLGCSEDHLTSCALDALKTTDCRIVWLGSLERFPCW